MRILLIEDSDQLAGAVSRELEREYGHTVMTVGDPVGLERILLQNEFDVAVVDLMYEHLNRQFDMRRLSGQVRAKGGDLLISGLSAIRALGGQCCPLPTVVWTSGEANRRLHLLYSYQDMEVRNYCSKSPGTGRLDTLERAIRSAVDGQQYVDPVINPYLPMDHSRKASEILLEDECKRAIWRAIALGAAARDEVSSMTGYAARTVGRRIPEMFDNLLEFDVGLEAGRTPFVDIVRYVAGNWQFFLDEAVRLKYP